MASRLQNIILRARDTLADSAGERWSDQRLLRLASEGQQDIAKHTKILKGQVELSAVIGQSDYVLPDDVWELTRATFNGAKIPFKSYADLDAMLIDAVNADSVGGNEYNTYYNRIDNVTNDWSANTGNTIESIVFDRRNLSMLKVYPIPDETMAESYYTMQNAGYYADIVYEANSPFGIWTALDSMGAFNSAYGVTTDAESVQYLITDPNSCNGTELIEDVEFNSPYGLVGNITDNVKAIEFHGSQVNGVVVSIDDYTSNNTFGVLTNLYDPDVKQEIVSSPYGVVTNITETAGTIGIWYIRSAKELTTLESELEIPNMFDIAMKHYIVAHAFDDDLDTKYAEKSAKAFQYYARELEVIKQTDTSNATRASQYHNNYRGFR